MRSCAVVGCKSNTYQLILWKSKVCTSHGTHNAVCACEPPYVLFAFPTERKDPELRRKWTRLINRKKSDNRIWKPTINDRVCSKHFVDGRPTPNNPLPTLHLGYESSMSTICTPRVKSSRKTRCQPSTQSKPSSSSCPPSVVSPLLDHAYTAMHDITPSNNLRPLPPSVQYAEPRPKLSRALRFTATDVKTRKFTGLPNQSCFESLLKFVEDQAPWIRYWYGKGRANNKQRQYFHRPGRLRKTTVRDELTLVLMKLRTGVSNDLLCELFCIEPMACSSIVNTWLKLLANVLKPLIHWPPKQFLLDIIPPTLSSRYRQLRCTIDCTEIFIEKPRDHLAQALTWSDYKKHNTAKYLIAIAPNGCISFLSKAWGGRTSDRHIVQHSGFLDRVDPGDLVLADRGFTIREDLLLRHVTLEIPPAGKGIDQMPAQDVAKTKEIANVRIHVERAIGRIKWFRILSGTVPITLVPHIDNIVIICSALTNLLPPLVV